MNGLGPAADAVVTGALSIVVLDLSGKGLDLSEYSPIVEFDVPVAAPGDLFCLDTATTIISDSQSQLIPYGVVRKIFSKF